MIRIYLKKKKKYSILIDFLSFEIMRIVQYIKNIIIFLHKNDIIKCIK